MNYDIRLVVCDLDGTLLPPTHQLQEPVIAALAQFQQEGGMVTIATGRPILTSESIVRQLGISLPAIYCNGAVIAETEKVWHQEKFSAAPFLHLKQAAEKSGAELLLFSSQKVYAFGRNRIVEQYEEKEQIVCKLITEEQMLQEKELNKLLLIGPFDTIKLLWEQAGEWLQENYTVLQSEDTYLEIVPRHINKGMALCRLMDLLGVQREEVLAIGNQINDLELLQQAGVGVAVGNSHPRLMKQADYVCTSEYGDGVIEALSRYGCITTKN